MGVRFPSVQSNTFIGPLPANATETVVLTTPPLNLPIDGATVMLVFSATISPGTSTTSLDFRLRRGTTSASPTVTANTLSVGPVTPGNRTNVGGGYFDTPGIVAGVQYSLTVAQNGATAVGLWLDGALLAFVL